MSPIAVLLTVLLIVLLVGVTPVGGGNFFGAGYPLGGSVGLVVLVLLVLLLTGRL